MPISEDSVMHFIGDAIVRDTSRGGSIVLLEHKTGSRLSRNWADRWSLSVQVGTYMHVLYCMFDPSEIYLAVINGAFFYKGSPPEFSRVVVRKTPLAMSVWLDTVRYWASRIKEDTQAIEDNWENEEEQDVMSSFPMNTEACTRYFGCPYIDFCIGWPNPLRRTNEVPFGFVEEFWDPSDYEGLRTLDGDTIYLKKGEKDGS